MSNYVAHRPRDLGRALALSAEYGHDAVFLAGATELAVQLGRRALQATHLISLRAIRDLQGMRLRPDGSLWIGALTTHQQAAFSPLVRDAHPTLARMFERIGSVRIRNQATVGGNLATAERTYDPPPMLVVLDAVLEVVGSEGTMHLRLDDFWVQRGAMPQALVSSVVVPPLGGSDRCVYQKLTDPAGPGSGSIQVAGRLTPQGDGGMGLLRLVVGGLSPTPVSSAVRIAGRPGLDARRAATVACEQLIPQLEPEPGGFLVDLLRVVVGRTVDDLGAGREDARRG